MTTGPRRLVHRRAGALRGHAGDAAGGVDGSPAGGFILLEEIVSITLVMIVMAALATFFLTVTQSTSYERGKQSAVQLANSELNLIRGVPAADLVLGRSTTQVSSQFANAPAAVQPWLTSTTIAQVADPNATTATTQTVPMSATATANSIAYTITNYLGTCSVPTSAGNGTDCSTSAAAVSAGTSYLRAVVAVTWRGVRCPANVCSYVTGSLVSTAPDATFVSNQLAPATPLVANPGNQVTTVGAPVSLQLALQPNTGVAPVTWSQTGLPSWLTMTAAGLITGTAPATAQAAVSVQVVATDAFLRSDPTSPYSSPNNGLFTWTVVAAPTISGLTNPFTTTGGSTITPQTLPYTCPTTTCTYTVAGVPAGIGLSTSAAGPFTASVNTTGTTGGNLYLGGTTSSALLPASTAYSTDVLNQGATNYWRLAETTGTTGADLIGANPLAEVGGVGHTALGAVLSSSTGAATFDGSTGFASTQTAVNASGTSTESVWFRTTSSAGGPLMALESTTGTAGTNDRIVYLNSAGQLTFGLSNGAATPSTVTTTAAYNDGLWHQVVGTLSGAGQSLYVDGALVGTNPGVTGATFANAYWHVGAARMSGWPSAPTSGFFAGTIDDAAVSSTTALTLAQVQQQYADSGRVPFAVVLTPTDTVSSISGAVNSAAWTVVPPPVVSIAPFTTTAGARLGAATVQAAELLPYNCPTGACSMSVTGAPGGIGLATPPATAAPFTATVPVTATNGSLTLGGTVSAAIAPSATAYAADVTGQGASNYWRLGETSGSTAADSVSGGSPLTELAGVTHGVPGAILSRPSGGAAFDGSAADGSASTTTAIVAPTTFSESIWFRTAANYSAGGRLMGFSSAVSGTSASKDRQIIMNTAGQLVFSVAPGGSPKAVTSTASYNDGNWHQAVVTMSPTAGMALYVDGMPAASNATYTAAQAAYTGYWRLGGDGLTVSFWGPGLGSYFQGTLDDAAVYPSVLSAANVQTQYADSGRVPFTVAVAPTDTAPTPDYAGTVASAAWTVYSPPSVIGLTSPFSTTPGSTITSQYLPYNCPTGSCTYTVSNAPGGIGLATTVNGTAATSVTVTATSGTLYLVGTVAAATPSGSSTVTVTSTDAVSGVLGTSSTATWVIGGATVTGLTTPFTTFVSATIASQPLSYTCGSSGCTFTLTGAPAGIGLSSSGTGAASTSVSVSSANGTIYLVGTVGGSPNSYTLVVTPRDTVNGVTGTPNQASWTVYAKPTVTGLTNPFTTTAGATIANQSLPYTCPSSACTFSVAGAPTGIGLASSAGGPASSSVTVTGSTSGTLFLSGTVAASAASTSATYANDVSGQHAGDYWRLGEASGSTGVDSAGNLPLTEQAGVGHNAPGAVVGSADTASTFDGSTSGYASTQTAISAPQVFSESIWFRTTSTTGGKLIGFGNSTTGLSTSYDRQLYMDNSGHVIFGVYPNSVSTVTTPGAYNDGLWHQAVGTLSAAGQVLYIDGTVAGTNTGTTGAEVNTGYWRIGGDNLVGWPGPVSSNFFTGSLDEAAIYPAALTATQVQQQWADAHASTYALTVTPTDTATPVTGTVNSAAWTVNPPPAVAGQTAPLRTSVGSTILNDAVTYSCPSTACTFGVSGAPSGIGLYTSTTATTSGSPSVTVSNGSGTLYLRGTIAASTATGSSTVAITYSDNSTGVTGTASSSAWTLLAAMNLGSPGALTTSRLAVVSKTFAETCQISQCTVSVVGAPSGIGLSTSAAGLPAASVMVNAGTATLYLKGTVSALATSGSYPITLTTTDPAGSTITTSVTWTVS